MKLYTSRMPGDATADTCGPGNSPEIEWEHAFLRLRYNIARALAFLP
jgi:hypothetical protein